MYEHNIRGKEEVAVLAILKLYDNQGLDKAYKLLGVYVQKIPEWRKDEVVEVGGEVEVEDNSAK